jgi:cytochrome c556
LYAAAMLAAQAADKKDADKVFEVGEAIEHACEGCHRAYWYPNEKIPELPEFPETPAK